MAGAQLLSSHMGRAASTWHPRETSTRDLVLSVPPRATAAVSSSLVLLPLHFLVFLYV